MTRDPLGGMFFTQTHLHVFRPIVIVHLTCVFPSLANDMHIIGLASDMVPNFLGL
jgi:hypothetical protein